MSRYPVPGDRVGFVCGPCEDPRDNSGIVLAVYANRWSQNNAVILMDDGSIQESSSQLTSVGIGMRLVQSAQEPQQ
jgi:hypothetical protein